MSIAALIIYILWFALAFGARTVIALRQTGESGWRGISGRPLTLEWWAGVLFAVALVVGITAPVAALAGLQPLTNAPLVPALGIAVAVIGVVLTVAAQISMGDSWRVGVEETERTDLVITGAFALARNPIFTAMTVTAAGLTLMVPNIVAVTGLVALVVALQLQVRGVEEPYLLTTHDRSYTRYAAHVGRFLPGVGRLTTD